MKHQPPRVCLRLSLALLALGLWAGASFAQAPLQLTNVDSGILAKISAEGISGGEQIDSLSRPMGDLTVLGPLSAAYPQAATEPRATLELDGGNDLFRFEGNTACAGLVEVSWVGDDGTPLSVLDARIVAARADDRGAFLVQAVSTVDAATSSEQLAVLGDSDFHIEVSYSLGADERGRAASFTRRFQANVPCDGSVALQVVAGDTSAVQGISDVGPAPSNVIIPARADGRTLLDSVVGSTVQAGNAPIAGNGIAGSNIVGNNVKSANRESQVKAGEEDGATFFCTDDGFDGPDLGAEWNFALLGDADQGSATVVGNQLRLSGDGTSLYHGDDNGAFVYQNVNGDFRAEVTLTGVPVDQGGDFRKAGLMVRESLDPLSARVMIQLVVDHPVYNTTALQFDYRDENGNALELASTPVGLNLPLSIAVDRRGDLFTVYYSPDGGASWLKPLGGQGQGEISLPIGPTAQVGMAGASYDANLELAVDFDDFELCHPSLDPAPEPPPALGCQAGRSLDLTYLVDASGSMTAAFPGATSKLAAVATAIAETNTALGANFPGSRSALVTYRASVFSDPAYNLAQGAQIVEGFSTNLQAVIDAAAAIDPSQIHPDANTPAPIALDRTTDMLETTVAAGALPVVLWLTDGAPNIDSAGQGPLEYRFSEILPLDIRANDSSFLAYGQVAWLGNWNGGIGTYDGQVFANTIYEIQNLKNTVPDALIYPVAIRGEDTYYEDLMAYAAYYTGTRLLVVDDIDELLAEVASVITELDCGATIGDLVWHDSNADGVVDGGESGLSGVTVELRDAGNTVVDTDVTDGDGLYLFENVVPGTYMVTVDASSLPAPFTSPTYDLDGIGTPNAASLTVAAGDERLDVDFGYRGTATLGDRVWLDANGDGVQDVGEVGLESVGVELLDGSNASVGNAITGPDGEYLFTDLPAGTYTVVVDPMTLPATVSGQSYDLDGLATPDQASLTVGEGDERLDVDFGYLPAATCTEGIYRDDFNVASFANQDGTLEWTADWVEDDPTGPGVGDGQVQVHDGLLTLDDAPDSGGEPGVERQADLSDAGQAILSFRFLTSGGVDSDDAVTVEVSSDGGANWNVLEVIDGIHGSVDEERSYDITGFASEDTRVRLRVTNKYGGNNELFCLDWLEIAVTCTECDSRTVRDDFDHRSYSNNDGPDLWTAAWSENDSAGAGPNDGAVRVDSTGFLTLQLAEKAVEPSISREVNLSGAATAVLGFRFVTSSKTDADDVFLVEASSDGGATWTLIDTVTGIAGYAEITKSYDLSAHISSRTVVRLRVPAGSYLGYSEGFCLDWVEIASLCEGEEFLGSLAGVVWNDINGNGIQEDASTGLGNVKVKLIQDGTVLAWVRTDDSGAYAFDNLPAGTYKVKVVASTLPQNLDEATWDLDGVNTLNKTWVDLAAGQSRDDVRFGYRNSAGSAPCSDCEHYSGWLSGSGDSEIEPDGNYIWSNSGNLEGWLQADGVDYDLYLYRWNGSRWKLVRKSIEDNTDEHISYWASPGYYLWKIKSWSGSGEYDFWYSEP